MEQQAKKQQITNSYNKFWKELYVVAFRRLRNEEQVEDILQDLFLSLLEGEPDLSNEASVRALLHARLKSRIIDFFRKELLKTSYQRQQALNGEPVSSPSDASLLDRELETVIATQIQLLPEKMREIFLLSRGQLLSNQQIAAELHISDKTVRNQLSTALTRIRASVRQYKSADPNPASVNILVTLATLMLSKY